MISGAGLRTSVASTSRRAVDRLDATLTAGGAGYVLEVNPVSGPGFQLVCGPHLGDPTAREIFAQVPRYPWSCLWPRWATPFAWRSSDPVSRATPGRRAELEAKKARGT